MKKCPYCNKKIEDNAKFCLYCMRELGKKRVLSAAAFKSKKIILSVCAVAVALAIVTVSIALKFILKEPGIPSDGQLTVNNSVANTGDSSVTPSDTVDTSHDTDVSSSQPFNTSSLWQGGTSSVISSSSSAPSYTSSASSSKPSSTNTLTTTPSFNPTATTTTDLYYSYYLPEERHVGRAYAEAQQAVYDSKFGRYTETFVAIRDINDVPSDGVLFVPDKITYGLPQLHYNAGEERIYTVESLYYIPKDVKILVIPPELTVVVLSSFYKFTELTDVYIMGEKIEWSCSGYENDITFHSSATCKQIHQNGTVNQDFKDEITRISKQYSKYCTIKWEEWDGIIDF